jgi:putative nucleotidyltransferase with HDIG domain
MSNILLKRALSIGTGPSSSSRTPNRANPEPSVLSVPAAPAAIPDGAKLPATLGHLPMFRPVAAKVLRALSEEGADLTEITRLIQADPFFSAELLQLANSPLFGFACRISSIQHVVVILGLERTKSMTLSIAMRSLLRKGIQGQSFKNCWGHSVACAQLAHDLAPKFGLAREKAYTAGLVHDIGRLGLLSGHPTTYGAVLEQSYPNLVAVLQAEQNLFQMDHCVAGRWLAKVWQFPDELGTIAAHHHDVSVGRDRDFVSLVRFSCLLADSLGYEAVRYQEPLSPEELLTELPPDLRLDELCFDELRGSIQERTAGFLMAP